MSEFHQVLDADLLRRVEQFYFREARLLDGRHYLEWLTLLSRDIVYRIPSRFVPLAHSSTKNPEAIHAIENELSGYDAGGLPIREEGYDHLATRAARALKPNAWAENPPPRTRRFVMNIEVEPLSVVQVRVFSNFQLFSNQRGRPDHVFTGQRRDRLERKDSSFRIAEREVILDGDVVTGASVAMFF